LTDHPLLIPTMEGAVGGIVSEPEGPSRAALVLLAGYGRPARSGVNAFWTRTARRLAEIGMVVLRIDYSREGETLPIGEGGGGQTWKRDLDLRLLTQVVPWFSKRAGDLPLLLAGSCSGARLAIEYAGRDPDTVAGTFLVVPYLRALAQPGTESLEGSDDELDAVDPIVVDCMRATLEHAPSWILVGEHDDPDVTTLEHQLSPQSHSLEIEIVPGMALHLLDQPQLQDEVTAHLLGWASSITAAFAHR
jgi:dienelactone hydrolase